MFDNVWTLIITGIVFGLSGGITPGPLLMLIISETIKYGWKEGFKLSFVPIMSDLPVVLLSLGIIARLKDADFIIGLITIGGAMFITYLAYESLTFSATEIRNSQKRTGSLSKGVLLNLLNPNPYIFWLSIGAPTVIRATEISRTAPAFFILAMYLFLIGSKVSITFLVNASRSILKNRYYLLSIRTLGFVLLIFALIFFYKGLQTLQIV